MKLLLISDVGPCSLQLWFGAGMWASGIGVGGRHGGGAQQVRQPETLKPGLSADA